MNHKGHEGHKEMRFGFDLFSFVAFVSFVVKDFIPSPTNWEGAKKRKFFWTIT